MTKVNWTRIIDWAVVILYVILLLATLGWLQVTRAEAQDTEDPVLSFDDTLLALAIAQVAANEASLYSAHPADVALIYQTTRSHGESSIERLAWLRQHSNCVLGTEPLTRYQRRTNCAFTRYLTDSDAEPQGWPARYGVWDALEIEKWRNMRHLARRLVAGVAHVRMPCHRDPWTWGGTMDHLTPGMVDLGCVGTFNRGVALRRRSRVRAG